MSETSSHDLVIRAQRVYLAERGDVVPAAVYVSGSKIVRVQELTAAEVVEIFCQSNSAGEELKWLETTTAPRVLTLSSGHLLMPGLVDSHVHVNAPGRESWGGFDACTRAAASGGVTTIADMPLNSEPVTTTLKAFQEKVEHARGKCYVDVGFLGGIVPGDVTTNVTELATAGVCGFKGFLIDSGIDTFPPVGPAEVEEALQALKPFNLVHMFHAELDGSCACTRHESEGAAPASAAAAAAAAAAPSEGMPKYAQFLASRPASMEKDAVSLVVDACRKTKGRCHIVHLSSPDSVPVLREARAAGLPITVETCPHYLYFSAEFVPEGDKSFKCCPPIRTADHREGLWRALADGEIDQVVSDHSSSTSHEKQGDWGKAWGGIASVGLTLPILYTECGKRGLGVANIARWACEAPARLLNLDQRKGRIAVGMDADFAVFNTTLMTHVDPTKMNWKDWPSPYTGKALQGAVEMTLLRGNVVYHRGVFSSQPQGEFVSPSGTTIV